MKRRKKESKIKKTHKLTIACLILDILAIICFVLVYGPYDKLRKLYINTAMNTMDHQYLAKVFYNQKTIDKILNSNYFITIDEDVVLENIVIDTKDKGVYENEYDKEILTRDEGNTLYKIINLKIGNTKAYLVAIYDPTKVEVVAKEKFGGDYGERIITMANRYGGTVCINGGGFVDNGYGSGIPIGYIIEDGKIRWTSGDSSTQMGNIIGFTEEGKLLLMGNATGDEALAAGIVDALEFGPFLIVNGKPIEIVGDPWGKAPRTAIAQRKDGIVLFLVSDGENYINGASLQEIVDTLMLYGAYNAANLDGGQSSTLIVNNKLYNSPPAAARSTQGRYVISGWCLVP